MGHFFSCFNNENRNYNTFGSSDDNVIYQQRGVSIMYFSVQSRCFDSAEIYFHFASQQAEFFVTILFM